jgi:hypothetical protein
MLCASISRSDRSEGLPKRWLKPRHLSVGRSKAYAEIHEDIVVDAKH